MDTTRSKIAPRLEKSISRMHEETSTLQLQPRITMSFLDMMIKENLVSMDQ
jgi:hypothetical protein